jgi:hypothetical protein
MQKTVASNRFQNGRVLFFFFFAAQLQHLLLKLETPCFDVAGKRAGLVGRVDAGAA